jgi:hypothetical protein
MHIENNACLNNKHSTAKSEWEKCISCTMSCSLKDSMYDDRRIKFAAPFVCLQVGFQCLLEWESGHERVMICTKR